jgi:hypothetical protein
MASSIRNEYQFQRYFRDVHDHAARVRVGKSRESVSALMQGGIRLGLL